MVLKLQVSIKYFSTVKSTAAAVLLIRYEVTQEENSLCDNMKTHICQKNKRVCIENPFAVVGVKWFIKHVQVRHPTFQTGKCTEKIEFCSLEILYYTPKCVLFCPLQVILYPTSSSSKSAELHQMIVPKNSQDSDLKIKLAVRMDKPPHMKHSG